MFLNFNPYRMIKELVVVPRKELTILDSLGSVDFFAKGVYRVITKCKAGFMVSSEVQCDSPIQAFRGYQRKAIASIAFISPVTGTALTVYARVGKKVWAMDALLKDMEVGDINQSLYNTGLYSMAQYKAVNSKTWADKAYVMNK
jgi:hypothetical protein